MEFRAAFLRFQHRYVNSSGQLPGVATGTAKMSCSSTADRTTPQHVCQKIEDNSRGDTRALVFNITLEMRANAVDFLLDWSSDKSKQSGNSIFSKNMINFKSQKLCQNVSNEKILFIR